MQAHNFNKLFVTMYTLYTGCTAGLKTKHPSVKQHSIYCMFHPSPMHSRTKTITNLLLHWLLVPTSGLMTVIWLP